MVECVKAIREKIDQYTVRNYWIKIELGYPGLDINTELEENLMNRREDPMIIEPEPEVGILRFSRFFTLFFFVKQKNYAFFFYAFFITLFPCAFFVKVIF